MEAIIKEFQKKGFITNEATYGKEITNAELLASEVDVLAPCALENQLTSENAEKVRATIVVEARERPDYARSRRYPASKRRIGRARYFGELRRRGGILF